VLAANDAVVEQAMQCHAIGIANQRIGKTCQINKPVPIGIIASEPRHEAEYETDVCERHFGGEASKARSCNRAATGKAGVLIDDNDPVLRPAEFTSLDRECVRSVDSRLCSTWAALDWRK
jgi:hypothetical protein